MGEELDIPMPRMAPAEPGYRLSRAREPVDATTKRLAVIGAGMALVLVGVVGVYALSGHRGGAVPVVQADGRPLRSKPENRGGMQLSGQDDAILSGDSGGKDALAPPPEQPAPQGLADQAKRELDAKQEAATAPEVAPPPPTAPAPTVSAPTVSAPTVSAPAVSAPAAPTRVAPTRAASLDTGTPPPQTVPIAAMPETKPVHASPAKPPAPAVGQVPSQQPSQLGGHAQVQLAALDSEQAALVEWQRLSHRMPSLLAGRQPSVQRTDHGGKTYFRLRTGGFVDIAQATAFCGQVRAQGGGCSLASF